MKIVRVSRSELVKRMGPHTLGYYDTEEGVAYLPHGASTATRLHETYHADISPRREDKSYGNDFDEVAMEELEARQYQREKMSKSVNTRDLAIIGGLLIEHGSSKSSAMASVLRASAKLGYDMSGKGIRRDLWKRLGEYKPGNKSWEEV